MISSSPLANNDSPAFDWEANEHNSNNKNKNSEEYDSDQEIDSSNFVGEEIADNHVATQEQTITTETSSPASKLPQPLGWD